MKRNTIQKILIADCVRSMDDHPTADQIYDALTLKYPGISKGTVYRNLGTLAQEGTVRRVAVANAPDRFDHTTVSHAHFRCRLCGKVFDYNIKEPVKADDALNPGLKADDYELIFTGRCINCKEDNDG
ncbi:MAG: transcriptional repressor [Oscillospiraceae bacterium]|nr:transcriptional repressor [Oscillospiraceae bacterium]